MKHLCLSSSENLFMDMADRLAEDGWKELGYVYVNIDDCWSSKQRDDQGRLQPDPKRCSICCVSTKTIVNIYLLLANSQ